MRHNYFGRKLNRDVKERKALFRSLIRALILHEQVTTTVARAKAIRSLAEKLVTAAKDGSSSAVQKLSSFLVHKEIIEKLRNDIAPRFTQKVGGYLRIVRVGVRPGDMAQEVVVEWTSPAVKADIAVKSGKKATAAKKLTKKQKKVTTAKKTRREKAAK